MRYYLPADHGDVDPDREGLIISPKMPVAYERLADVRWIGDNGQFGRADLARRALTEPFPLDAWLRWLDKVARYAATCDFIVIPDHPCHHYCTLRMYERYQFPPVERGLRVALAAQDGAERGLYPYPWPLHGLFIAGSTAWKLGPGAAACIRAARRAGIHVHVGRVNSRARYRHFVLAGADSCDGTFPIYAPRQNRRRMQRWYGQPALMRF